MFYDVPRVKDILSIPRVKTFYLQLVRSKKTWKKEKTVCPFIYLFILLNTFSRTNSQGVYVNHENISRSLSISMHQGFSGFLTSSHYKDSLRILKFMLLLPNLKEYTQQNTKSNRSAIRQSLFCFAVTVL